MDKLASFTKLLFSQVNRGIYVWGGNGEDLTAMSDPIAWIARHEEDPENEKRDIALYEKRKKDGVNPIQAFDCSGLVYWALNTLGLQKDDLSSHGLYAACEKITEAELRAGDLVFHAMETKEGTQRIVHVGVFVGGGYFVECRGRDVGVVRNKRKAGYWTHFGRFPGLTDQEPQPEPEPQTEPKPQPEPQPRAVIRVKGSVRVREKNSPLSKKIATVKDCDLPYLGQAIEPPYWYMTQVFDKSGELRDGYISSKPKYTEVVTVYV